MTEQLLIRIDPQLKRRLARLATMEGRTTTEVVRKLIEGYVKQRDIAAHVGSLWDRIGGALKAAGARPADVGRAVRAVRRAKAAHAGRR